MTQSEKRFARRVELPLPEAITRWCDERLIEQLKDREEYFSDAELLRFGYPSLAHAMPLSAKTQTIDREERTRWANDLHRLWLLLLDDFRKRVKARQIWLQGVLVEPTRTIEVVRIPSEWASTLRILPRSGVIYVDGQKYDDIVVSDKAWTSRPTAIIADATTSGRGITVEGIPYLDDDVILALLEEHAKRVTENDARLIHPSRISLMPMIQRKMRHRATQNQLAGRVSWEADALARWIAERLPSFQVPTAGSIENNIRAEYGQLQARSTSIVP